MEKAQSGVEDKKYVTIQSPTEQARGSPATAAGEQQPTESTVTLPASRCRGCPKLPVPMTCLREPKSQKDNVLGTVTSMYSRAGGQSLCVFPGLDLDTCAVTTV